MPRGDRRGPAGKGAMTGRALGFCAGNDRLGYAVDSARQGVGRGFRNGVGRGRGFRCGRGMRHGFAVDYEQYTPAAENSDLDSEKIQETKVSKQENEISRLQNLTSSLTSELENLKNEIDRLKNK